MRLAVWQVFWVRLLAMAGAIIAGLLLTVRPAY